MSIYVERAIFIGEPIYICIKVFVDNYRFTIYNTSNFLPVADGII